MIYITDPNMIIMPREIKKNANVNDYNAEYEMLQDVRRQFTQISATLSELSGSNNLEIKMIAKRMESEIDKMRRELFDFSGESGTTEDTSDMESVDIPGFEGTMDALDRL